MVKKSKGLNVFACYGIFILVLAALFGVLYYYNNSNVLSGELIGKVAGCENCRSQLTYFHALNGADTKFTPDYTHYYIFNYVKRNGIYSCVVNGEERFGLQPDVAFPVELDGKIYYMLIHPWPGYESSKSIIRIYGVNRN